MQIRMYLMIDRTAGEAVLASSKAMTEITHKSITSILYGAQHFGTLNLIDRTVELHQLTLVYNFYDAETGKMIAKHKRFSNHPDLDETGYEEKELRLMQNSPYGYEGLKAKKILMPVYDLPDFPAELYEEFQDLNVIRRYRRGEGNQWTEYYL